MGNPEPSPGGFPPLVGTFNFGIARVVHKLNGSAVLAGFSNLPRDYGARIAVMSPNFVGIVHRGFPEWVAPSVLPFSLIKILDTASDDRSTALSSRALVSL